MRSGGGGAAVVADAVTGVHAAVDGLLAVPLQGTAPADRLAALRQVETIGRQLDAVRLRLVRSLDTPAIGADGLAGLGATTLPRLLETELGAGTWRAAAQVAAARATDAEAALDPVSGQDRGTLPGMGAALSRGEVSAAHLDAAVRTMDKVPTRLRRAAAAVVDDFFVEVSRRHPPRRCENLAEELLDRLDPLRTERGYDPEAHLRRRLDLVVDSTGMVVLRGQLDPLTGAAVKAAVDHFGAPAPARRDDDGTLLSWDPRTPSQRRADALGLMASAALRGGGTRAGEPPRVVVHATTDQLAALATTAPGGRGGAGRAHCEQTGTVDAATLERIACDAVLQRVLRAPSGAVLDLGRTVRLATAAQRRALAARDLGCVVPGCGRPPTWCDAHHVLAWHRGGATDLDNLVLLCPAHHSAVHAGLVAVQVRDGVPVVATGRRHRDRAPDDGSRGIAAGSSPGRWLPTASGRDAVAVDLAAQRARLALDVPLRPPRPHPRT